MRAALDITLKDLRSMVRDRSALLIGVVAPFALAALFSSILGGVEDEFHARWGLVDLDGGALPTALREGPLAALADDGAISLEILPDAQAARTAVAEDRLGTAIIIPEGFSADVLSGASSTIEILADPDAGLSEQVARAVLTSFVRDVESTQLAVSTALVAAGEAPEPGLIAALSDAARAMPAAIVVRDESAEDREVASSTYYAAAMAVLFVLLAAQLGITSLHVEKRQRTLARMLAAPLHWTSIVVGKVLVSLTLALTSMSVIVVGTSLLLGARWGDPLAVAALLLTAALAATGVSLLVVSFTRSEDQAGAAVAAVAMLLAILGGSFFPVNQGPELLAQASLLTPNAWFMRGVGDISTGGDIFTASGPLAILVLIGIACGLVGLSRMRRLVLG
jgi:ABC-2 type transport system permease protein